MKLFILILFGLLSFNNAYTAVKVNISFGNFRIVSGLVTMDIKAQILAGQTWRVGSSNIRVDWTTIPPNSISPKPEEPAYNHNPNIHSNSSYGIMKTTVLSGSAICLNIVWNTLGACYIFNPGTYTLGSIRFIILDSSACFRLAISPSSVLQDSLTQLFNPGDWTLSKDTTCISIIESPGISSSANEIPKEFKLYNNFPNPFNPVTKIRFDIAKTGSVKIIIYDILAREVAVLVNEQLNPASYEVEFDGSNYASGIYYYRLETQTYTRTKKMVLIK